MIVSCKFSDKDIERIGEMEQIIKQIDCNGLHCCYCPLNINGQCLKTYLTAILTTARNERRSHHDN